VQNQITGTPKPLSDRLEHLKPTKKDLMISKIITGAACLAELTSNPKSFANCPDLHGGVPDLPRSKETRTPTAFTTNEEEQNVMFD
jgi:hypothetical protein